MPVIRPRQRTSFMNSKRGIIAFQTFANEIAHLGGVGDEVLAVDDIQRGQSRHHRKTALAERGTVHHGTLHGGKNLFMDPFLAQHRAYRHKPGGKAFGQHHDVRVHRAFVFDGQKSSGAPHARLHFVIDEQRAVLAAELLRGEEITGGREVHAFALDRFDDEARDVTLLQFRLERSQIVEWNRPAMRQERGETIAEAIVAIDRERAGAEAVKGFFAMDDGRLAGGATWRV